MDATSTVMIKLDADTSQATANLKKFNQELNNIIPGGKSVAQTLQRIQFGLLQIVQGAARNTFVGITSTFTNMAKAGMQVAETLEAAEVGFQSILAPGENVKSLLLDIQKNAVKTPFDVDDLTASTQKLALITKNGYKAEQTVLDLGAAVAAAGRGNTELNRMAINLQQIGLNSKATTRDIKEFGNAGVDILGLVAEYSKGFKETGLEASKASEWLTKISNPYEVIAEVLHKAATENGRFADIYEKGATTIKQANENMQDSMAVFSYRVLENSKILDKAKNIFSEFQNSLFLDETFTANTAAAIQHFLDMIDELNIIKPIIEGIKKVMSAFASGQFDNVVVFFKELFNTLKQFTGIKVITNAFQVIFDLFSDNHTASEVAKVAQQLGTLLRVIMEFKLLLSLSAWMSSVANSFANIGKAVMSIIPAFQSFVGAFPKLIASGGKFVLVAGLIAGAIYLLSKYGSQIGEIFGKLGDFFGSLANAIGNAVNEFVNVGYNLMTGLWNGIVDGVNAIMKAVGNVASSIVNAFKSFFGIHSPSTLMRDEVGRYIDEGIAEGIKKNYKTIASVTEEVLEELVKLQQQYVKELSDFGALDLVQTMKVYKQFAALYKEGTKARIEMDDKVHDSEVNIVKEMISLIETYNKQWDKVYSNTKNYYDLVKYTETTLVRSTNSVIEAIRRQNDNLTQYYTNLKAMSEMGYSSDFMEYIMEQGMDAASEVAGLANATQEQIERINEMWETRGKVAADIATLNTKKLKEDTLEELDYLQQGLETKILDYYDTGTKLDYNFANGIYDWMPTIEDAMMRVQAKTKKGSEELGDAAVDALNGTIGDISDNLIPQLEKLDIKMFDTNSLFSLFGNILKGIPWPVWVGAIVLVITKLKEFWDTLHGITPATKAIEAAGDGLAQKLGGSFSSAGSSAAKLRKQLSAISYQLQDDFAMLAALLEELVEAIKDVQNAIEGVSNYESVFRQATQGVFAITDEVGQQLVSVIDLAKSQGIITAQEATDAIGDIMLNGFDNASDESVATFKKIEQGLGVTINNSEKAMVDAVETINYEFNDIIAQAVYDSTNGITSVATKAVEAVGISIEDIKDKVVDEAGNITGDVLAVTKEMVQGMGQSWEQISDAGVKAFHEIDDEFNKACAEMEETSKRASEQVSESMQRCADGVGDATDEIRAIAGQAAQDIADINNKAWQNTGTAANKAYKRVLGETAQFHRDLKQSSDDVLNNAHNNCVSWEQTFATSSDHVLELSQEEAYQLNGNYAYLYNQRIRGHMDMTAAIVNSERNLGSQTQKIQKDYTGRFTRMQQTATAGLSKLGTSLKSFGSMLGGIAPTIGTGLTKAGTAITTGLDKVRNSGVTKIVEIGTTFKEKFSKTGASMATGIGQSAQTAKTAMGNLGNTLSAHASTVGEKVGNAYNASFGKLGSKVVGFFQKFTGTISGIINSFTQLVADILNKLVDTVMELIARVAGGIGKALASLLQPLSDPKLLIGVGALIGVAVALVFLAKACQTFAEVQWEDIGKAAVALIALGFITTILGALWKVLLAGAAVMAAIGLGLAVFAFGFGTLAQTLADASEEGARINMDGIWAILGAVTALGLGLTAGFGTNFLGAISGLFGMAMGGEIIVIAKCLAETSGYASQIDLLAIEYIAGAINLLGLSLGAGIITNFLGAVSGLFATMTAGEVKIIAQCLAEASIAAKVIELESLSKVDEAIEILGKMEFGGFLQNFGKAMAGAELAEVARSVDSIMFHIISICDKLKTAESIDDQSVILQVNKVFVIVRTVSAMVDDDFMSALGKNLSSTMLEGVATSVEKIMDSVINIVAKLKKAEEVDPKKDVTSQVGKVQGIVKAIDDCFKSNFFEAIGKNWTAGNVAGMAESAEKIITSVIKMVQDIQKLVQLLPDTKFGAEAAIASAIPGQQDELSLILGKVQTIIKTIDGMVEGDWWDEIFNGDGKKSERIANMAEQFEKIIDSVYNMCDKLKSMRSELNVTDVSAELDEVDKIVNKLANTVFAKDKSEDDLKTVAEKASQVNTFAGHFNTILGTIGEMLGKLAKFQSENYTVSKIEEYLTDLDHIITALAKVNPFEGDDRSVEDFTEVAKKAEQLKDAAGYYDEILGSVRSIVDKLVKMLYTDGYNYGKGGNKDIVNLMQNLSDIVNELGKINISRGQSGLDELKDKSASLKQAATNLDEIITTITTMLDHLNAFTKKFEGTSVKELVAKVNDEILKPLIGDGANGVGIRGAKSEYPGITIPAGTGITTDNVTKLQTLNSMLKEIATIVTTLETIKDPSQGILNTEKVVKFITDTMATIPEKIKGYEADLKLSGEAYANSFITGWNSKIEEGKTVAQSMHNAFWSVLESKMMDEFWQGAALGGKVIDGLNSKLPEFAPVAEASYLQYWTVFESHFQDEYWQGAAWGGKVLDGLRSKVEEYKQVADKSYNEFYNQLKSQYDPAYTQGATVSGKIIDGIWSKQGDWWGAGDNIVAGVAGGINRNMWQINQAAGNISATAINRLRELLKIKSPSRVMMEMGGYVTEGFAEGITNDLGAVESAGEQLAEAIMDGYNDSIKPLGITAFEARVAANEARMGYGTTTNNRNLSVVQNNNIYNDMDTSKALSDIAWAIQRA